MAPPPALPHRALTVLLFLLLASTARSQEDAPSPTTDPPASAPLTADAGSGTGSQLAHPPISVSHPPTASAPITSDAADAPSPPPPASPKTAPSSDTPAPSHSHLAHPPAADHSKPPSPAPAPAPAADQIKAAAASIGGEPEEEEEEHRDLNGGGKAGVVLGTFAAAAVLGLGVFVWRKRRANIRRARYADYAARMELV